MMRMTLKVHEVYIRWVAVIYLILGTLALTTLSAGSTGYPFHMDFWGWSGLQGNTGLAILYLLIGALAALIGFLIGTPEPAYTATMVISVFLIVFGLLGFIFADYFGLLGGAKVQAGDNILNILVGLVGIYTVLTRTMRPEGGEARPGRAGQ